MSAASQSPTATFPQGPIQPSKTSDGRTTEWLRIGAGGALLTGALLLLSGKRRAGLLATATGAALAVLDQKDTVKVWWDALPGYLERTQQMLDEAQHTIDDIAAKRDKLKSLLGH